MAKLVEVECPCCQTKLKIDPETQSVISHKVPEKPPAIEDLAAAVAKLKGEAGHEVYTISDTQLAEWKKAAEPLHKTWADNVKKAGGDPDAVMKDLTATLAKYQAAY